jgi:hypothetical protein
MPPVARRIGPGRLHRLDPLDARRRQNRHHHFPPAPAAAYSEAINAVMRYWLVNQNQTYRAEVRGSCMWSPKQNANGARNQVYENMREVSPGNVLFSFFDIRINAIGVVPGGSQTGPKR